MCSIAIFHDILLLLLLLLLSVVHRSVNQGDTLLIRNIVHANYTWNIEMNAWSKMVGTQTQRYSSLDFYF